MHYQNLYRALRFGVLTELSFLFEFRPSCFEQTRKSTGSAMKDSISVNDFQKVTRFENFGGGWGYSGHSVEAIQFMADSDVVLGKCDFGLISRSKKK